MEKIAIGIMSGTSLDGIDVVLAKVKSYGENTKLEFILGETVSLEDHIVHKIRNSMDIDKSNVQLVTSLHYELGEVFANAVLNVLSKTEYSLNDISFVASHGQTIWHQPIKTNDFVVSSLQIGEGSIISTMLQSTVISNFRAADIASGGLGAPLVSYFDKAFFKNQDKTVSMHNLGGISNLTLLLKDKTVSYDTGPANMMINAAMLQLYGVNYDANGDIARSGKIIKELYEKVYSEKYFKEYYPKTTGRELFGDEVTLGLIEKYSTHLSEDIVHTFTMITIDTIVDEYRKLSKEYGTIDEIVFSGGGVHNTFILDKVKESLQEIEVCTIEKYGLSSDFKEALAFIFLGNETLNKVPSNDPESTGAKKKAILGQINYYYKEEKRK